MRQIASDKLAIILELKSTPIVLVCCKKIGLSTSTFYRWLNQDKRFAREVKRAIARGREDVSDIAEAHLVRAVKKGDTRSVFFWLKTFRAAYKKQERTIIEVKQKTEMPKKELRGRRDVLLPSTPIDPNPIRYPKIEKQLGIAVKAFFRKTGREEALMKELGKRGASSKEIEDLLKGIKEEPF